MSKVLDKIRPTLPSGWRVRLGEWANDIRRWLQQSTPAPGHLYLRRSSAVRCHPRRALQPGHMGKKRTHVHRLDRTDPKQRHHLRPTTKTTSRTPQLTFDLVLLLLGALHLAHIAAQMVWHPGFGPGTGRGGASKSKVAASRRSLSANKISVCVNVAGLL